MYKYMEIIRKTNPKKDTFYYPTRSLLDDFFFTPSIMEMPVMSNPLSADMWEEDDKINIKMAMPGIKKEDIKITIEDDRVCISGNSKKEEESDKKRKYYYRSMESSFEQTFNLPSKVDSNKAEAEFKDGVIRITLPKEEAVKPKEIEIK